MAKPRGKWRKMGTDPFFRSRKKGSVPRFLLPPFSA
jgi:hypothetical protein